MYLKRVILRLYWFFTRFLLRFGIILSRSHGEFIILELVKDKSLAEKISNLFALKEPNRNTMQFMGDELCDGSYPVPRSVDDSFVCLSAGVGPSSKFEEDLSNKFNIKSYMIDGSVDQPASKNDNFYFQKLYLTDADTENSITLDTWMEPHDKIILQMDIEGWEYSSLSKINKQFVQKVSVLIVEFHFLETFLGHKRYEALNKILSNLLENYWQVYCRHNVTCPIFNVKGHHIPNATEVVFLNKKYWRKDATQLPVPPNETVVDYLP